MNTAILSSRVSDNIFQYFCRVKNFVKYTGPYYQYGPAGPYY